MRPSIDSLVSEARQVLRHAPHKPAAREAHLLLAHVLRVNEVTLRAHGEREVEPGAASRFRRLLERRHSGEPIAYLTGTKEFYGHAFTVDRRVLIPRPETEHLVQAALDLDLPPAPRILDICTGSGCVGVALALEIRDARVLATDKSLAALAVARLNAKRLGVEDRVQFLAADLAAGVECRNVDLVVSNPPYVDPDSPLSREIRDFEPHLALFAGDDGFRVVDRLIAQQGDLAAGVPLLIEIGAGQRDTVARLAAGRGFEVLDVVPDYAGIPRVVTLRRP